MPSQPLSALAPQHSRAEAIARLLVFALLGTLAAVALLLLSRRMAGAFDAPLPGAMLLACGLALSAAAHAARRMWLRGDRGEHAPSASGRALRHFISWSPPACLAGVLFALWLPGTSPLAMFTLLALFIAEEAWSLSLLLGHRNRAPRHVKKPAGLRPAARQEEEEEEEEDVEANIDGDLSADVPPPHETEWQRLSRFSTAEGERLSGWFRVPFAPGQRTATAHLAFCPPFASPPKIEIEQTHGPSARIQTELVLCHGARFGVKLTQATPADASVTVEIVVLAADSTGDIASSDDSC